MASVYKKKLWDEESNQSICRGCGETFPEDDFQSNDEDYYDIDYLDSFCDEGNGYTYVNVESASHRPAEIWICPDGCHTAYEPESCSSEEDTDAWVCSKCSCEYGWPISYSCEEGAKNDAEECCA